MGVEAETKPAIRWLAFANGSEFAAALAETVADRLRRGVDARGGATLAVSGGSTPGSFLDALSREQLGWAKVAVTLVDDRFVPPTSARSNQHLARERLLVNEARLARFVPLWSKTDTVEEAARAADAGVALLPQPFDAVVLGMGTDGHTASFFPDAPNLAELIDPAATRRVLPVHAPSGGESRLTLTLPSIAGARFLALHIEGDAKRAAFDHAMRDGSDAPIRAVIAAAYSDTGNPVSVFWAP